MEEKLYELFAKRIYETTGMVYLPADYYRLEGRIAGLIKDLGLTRREELYSKLSDAYSLDVQKALITVATNNETFFFRDIKPFNALSNSIVPRILQENRLNSLNVWCAACSTGQEPYSVAMEVKEKCPQVNFSTFNIDASDISPGALEKAKRGEYLETEVKRGLSPELLTKYFNKKERDYAISPLIKGKVNFRHGNLVTDPFPIGKYHIVFCRNVLIYHSQENRQKVLSGLAQSLVEGGVLFLGSGESLIGFDVPFKQEMIDGCMVFRKVDALKKAG